MTQNAIERAVSAAAALAGFDPASHAAEAKISRQAASKRLVDAQRRGRQFVEACERIGLDPVAVVRLAGETGGL